MNETALTPAVASETRGTTWAWMVWTFVPWLNWVGWIHAGVRTGKVIYFPIAVAYATPLALMPPDGLAMPDWLAGAAAVSWIVGIGHALVSRKRIAAHIQAAGAARKTIKWSGLALSVTLLVSSAVLQEAWPVESRGWELARVLAEMPTARMAAAAAAAGNAVYVAGGIDSRGRVVDTLEAYDVDGNVWRGRTPMPAPRAMAAAVGHDDRVILFGGRNSAGVLNSVDAYDTRADLWTSLPPMPTARWGHAAAALGDLVYVAGGIRATGGLREALAELEIFDLRANQWSKGPALPAARQGAALAVVDGKLYILGGRDGAGDSGSATATVLIFDPVSGTYATGRPLARARTGAQAVARDGKIYVIGGAAEGAATDAIEVYDTAANASLETRLSGPRTGHAAVAAGARILVIGGADRESLRGILASIEFITP